MITQIYLIRHSESLKNINNILNSDTLQIQNEKKTIISRRRKKGRNIK